MCIKTPPIKLGFFAFLCLQIWKIRMKTIKKCWKTKPSSWWSWKRQFAPSYRQSARRLLFIALAYKQEWEVPVFRMGFTSIILVLLDIILRPDKVNGFYTDFKATEPKKSNFLMLKINSTFVSLYVPSMNHYVPSYFQYLQWYIN